MKKITDPARIEKLNASIAQSALPSFGGDEQQQQQEQPQQEQGYQGIMDFLANNPVTNTVLGTGDALRDMLSGGLLSKSKTTNFGYNAGPESSSGRAYEAGKIGGDIAGFIGGGEVLDTLRGALAAKNIPLVSGLAEALGGEGLGAGVARRATGGAIAGAAENPEDRTGGAARGVGYSLAGEALPFLFKGARAIGEKIIPREYTNKMLDEARKIYQFHKDRVTKLMEPIKNQFGNYRLYIANPSKDFLKIPQYIINKLEPELRDKYYDIVKNPIKLTFSKAHDFQQEVGDTIGKIKSDLPTSDRRVLLNSHMHVYNALKDDMANFLGKKNVKYAEQWKAGSDIHRDYVIPFRSDEDLRNVLEKGKKQLTPDEYKKILTQLYEGNKIPQNHYLEESLNKITAKINQASLLKKGLGHAITGATSLGLGPISGLIAHTAHPENLLNNPELIKMIQSVEPKYRKLVQAFIAPNLQRNQ